MIEKLIEKFEMSDNEILTEDEFIELALRYTEYNAKEGGLSHDVAHIARQFYEYNAVLKAWLVATVLDWKELKQALATRIVDIVKQRTSWGKEPGATDKVKADLKTLADINRATLIAMVGRYNSGEFLRDTDVSITVKAKETDEFVTIKIYSNTGVARPLRLEYKVGGKYTIRIGGAEEANWRLLPTFDSIEHAKDFIHNILLGRTQTRRNPSSLRKFSYKIVTDASTEPRVAVMTTCGPAYIFTSNHYFNEK